MRPTRRHPAARRSPRAFTLVEMLVVMFIIVTLVMLLMPTVNAARYMAKDTATRALIHSLETGLDMFKSESRLGRQYPPSYWQPGGPDPYGRNVIGAYGAQTLVWALAGPELLGTAGFLNDDLDALYNDLTTSPTLYGPFMDISKATIEKPAVLEGIPVSDAPVFMDNFGGAVLYFKANIGKGPEKIYNRGDNGEFLQEDPSGQKEHPLYLPGDWCDYDQNQDLFTKEGEHFLGYIEDLRVAKMSGGNRHAPHKPDSFLLITAGRDGLYGTADDIANFPFNALDETP